MAPTRMSLRPRRRENAVDDVPAGGATPPPDTGRRSLDGGHGSRRRAKASSSPSSSSAARAARAVMAAAAAEEASPDSKCPICLDRFNNLAYLDRCLHRFCFPCIQEWSNNKAECPLCKQPFGAILHSVRAEDDFKEYTPRPAPTTSSCFAATVAMVAAITQRQQVRLTMRRRRTGGETTGRRRRRESAGRSGAGRRVGMWRMYLEAPPPPALPPAPAVNPYEESLEERIRIVTELAERSAVIDGFAGLWLPRPAAAPNDRTSRRVMARLAARQRLQREGGAVRPLRERETVALRRALYRCGVRVRGVAGATDAPGPQQPDLSAESFRQSPALLSRLRPWLRRELTVLYGAHDSLVDVVQRIILARVAYYGLDAPIVADELRPYLLTRTDHFLHELVSFARSPLSLDSYDLQAVYEPPAEPDTVNSSSDSSSVISISEEEEEAGLRPRGVEPDVTLNEGSADDVIHSSLSRSGWDDETPGPSYSTAEPSCSHALSPAPLQPTNQEVARRPEEEECLIVGYRKPIAERTPELVQLSSDSEEDQPEPPATEAPPTIPPSTSGAFTEQPDGRCSHARPWSACTPGPEEEEQQQSRRKRRRRERKSAFSVSPLGSSSESEAPPTLTDSLWRGGSPCLSCFSSSSSPFLRLSPVSPPLAPPTDSRGDALRAEKPGGKRKYKSRHLNSTARERRRREGRGGRSQAPHSREQRSPSVEIIYEGSAHKHKHRRKRQRRKERSSSPIIITLDSDSNHDISPLQPMAALAHLPPLPMGGALSDDLPMEILDGSSDGWAELMGSDRTKCPTSRDEEWNGPIRAADSEAVGGASSPKHTSCWPEDVLPLAPPSAADHSHWDVPGAPDDHMTHLDSTPLLPAANALPLKDH